MTDHEQALFIQRIIQVISLRWNRLALKINRSKYG